MTAGAAIIIHDLSHARVAFAAAHERNVILPLSSPRGASQTLGFPLFQQIIETAAQAFPDVVYYAFFDCRDAAHALAALHHGGRWISVGDGLPSATLAKLRQIAGASGAVVTDEFCGALDMADSRMSVKILGEWLQNHAESSITKHTKFPTKATRTTKRVKR